MKIGRSVSTLIAAHNVLKTGVHGVGAKYIAKATASSQLVANADIKDSAGIAYSKLALAGELLAADIKAAADIPLSKLVDAVCSETEADNKITSHAGAVDPHGDRAYADGVVKQVATGTYTGNGSDNRQITVGFKCSLVIVYFAGVANEFFFASSSSSYNCRIGAGSIAGDSQDLLLHATDGFVVDNLRANIPDDTFYYWAMSE